MQTRALLKEQIDNNDMVLYMKGTPAIPMCGFSAKVAKLLQRHNAKFCYVNILDHMDIRAELPVYANWPTFPQLYIKGELIGGCDIVMELEENNQLLPILQAANVLSNKPEFTDLMA